MKTNPATVRIKIGEIVHSKTHKQERILPKEAYVTHSCSHTAQLRVFRRGDRQHEQYMYSVHTCTCRGRYFSNEWKRGCVIYHSYRVTHIHLNHSKQFISVFLMVSRYLQQRRTKFKTVIKRFEPKQWEMTRASIRIAANNSAPLVKLNVTIWHKWSWFKCDTGTTPTRRR